MGNYSYKILKSFFIKVTVIVMSLCYVFGPSHQMVSKLLHTLSHSIETSNLFTEYAKHEHKHHDHHHDHHHHHTQLEAVEKHTHSHKVLDVIDIVLEGSNSKNDSKNAERVSFKIDKHIEVKKNFKIQILDWSIKKESIYIFNIQKVHKGYLYGLIVPPQSA